MIIQDHDFAGRGIRLQKHRRLLRSPAIELVGSLWQKPYLNPGGRRFGGSETTVSQLLPPVPSLELILATLRVEQEQKKQNSE